jgi:hypothetical protein
MKTRKIVLVVTLSAGVLLFLGTCATTKTLLPTDNIDELLGTWVNPDYEGQIDPTAAKCIVKEDGSMAWYLFIKSGNPKGVSFITDVQEKWMDRKGAVYFKIHTKSEGKRYESNVLMKISSDRTIFEFLDASRMELLPSEMDPDAPYCRYIILYRQ